MAKLVRVCEAMRNTPVFADEYWRLKTQRNELRAECDSTWLAATGYDGSDYDPIFRDGVPDDWRGRWRLIREFTERWHGIPMPDIGGRPEEVRTEEERLGLYLPPSVREWVAFAHDCIDGRRADRTTPLRDGFSGLRRVPGQQSVAVISQAEGATYFAVSNAFWSAADGPISMFVRDWESEGEPQYFEHCLMHRSVSRFVFEYVVSCTHGAGHINSRAITPEQTCKELEDVFPINVPGGIGGRHLFESNEIIALVGRSMWGGRSQLNVMMRNPLPSEAIPAYLADKARGGGANAAVFLGSVGATRRRN